MTRRPPQDPAPSPGSPPATAESAAPAWRAPPRLRRFVTAFVALSVLATVAVVLWGGDPAGMVAALAGIAPVSLLALVGAVVLEWATDVVRYRTVARALDVPVPLGLSLEITFANLFFAYLTPGGGFGAPAVTWMLHRRGVDLPRAVALALIKPFLALFVLIPALVVLTFADGSEILAAPALQAVIAGTGVVAWTIITFIALAAIRPRLTRRLVDAPLRWVLGRPFVQRRFADRAARVRDGVGRTIDAFAAYLRSGPRHVAASALAAVADVAAMCLVAVVLLQALGSSAPTGRLWGLALLYVAVICVSPTPGAAGIAEGSGLALFLDVLPDPARLACFVVVWRAVTCYLPLVIGGVLFARFLRAPPADEPKPAGPPPRP